MRRSVSAAVTMSSISAAEVSDSDNSSTFLFNRSAWVILALNSKV